MELLFQYGLAGVVAYGAVAFISLIAKRKYNYIVPSDYKLYALVLIAFGVGFIPVNLGNVILNHIKGAVEIGFALGAFSTLANKAGGN